MAGYTVWSVLFPGKRLRSAFPAAQHLKSGPSLILVSLVINLLSLTLPLAILIVYDRIIPNTAYTSLATLAALLIGVALTELVLRISRAYAFGWSAARFELETVLQALSSTLLPQSGARGTGPHEQLQFQRLTAITRFSDFMGSQFRLALLDLPYVVLFLGVMWLIGGALVAVPIIMIAVFATAIWLLAGRIRSLLSKRNGQDSKIYDFVQDCLGGILTLKGLGMENQFLRRFEMLQKDASQQDYATIAAAGHSASIMGLFGNATIMAMVSTGGYLAVQGQISIGTLAACTLLAGRTVQPVLRVAGIWTELQRSMVALNDMAALQGAVDQAPTMQVGPLQTRAISDRAQTQLVPLRLVTEDLSLRSGHALALDHITMDAPAGGLIGIVGSNNKSRSMLLDVLSGALRPDSGTVHVEDPKQVEGARRAPYLGEIVLARPDQGLFEGTLLDNLTLFRKAASAEDARWAVRLLGLESDVHALPLGYDTPTGRRGQTPLASGFIQMLIIARAIAQRPRVLLLDQPQMFLDFEADRRIASALSALRGKMTVIMSTDRPSYMRAADQHWHLAQGRLQHLPKLDDALDSGQQMILPPTSEGMAS